MATIIDELIEVIEKQIGLYKEIYAISSEKKNVIIINDLETLQNMNTVENSIVNQVNKLEKLRLSIVTDICTVLGLVEDEFTLTKLSEKLTTSNDKEKIINLRDEIRCIMDNIKAVNDLNSQLINNSLEYIDFSLNLMRNVGDNMSAGYDVNELRKGNAKKNN